MPFDRSLLELGETLCEAQLGKLLGAWRIPFLLRKRAKAIKEFFAG
jgi:hypothetical protein